MAGLDAVCLPAPRWGGGVQGHSYQMPSPRLLEPCVQMILTWSSQPLGVPGPGSQFSCKKEAEAQEGGETL